MGQELEAGQPFPAMIARNIHGSGVSIPDPSRHWVHLQFRRFSGCPVCNLHLQTFVQRHQEVESAGIREVVVFHSNDEALLPYQGRFPFDVVGDSSKKFYHKYGVESSIFALLNPGTWPGILKGNLASDKPEMKGFPDGGPLGLPADFLISPTERSKRAITANTPTTSGRSTTFWSWLETKIIPLHQPQTNNTDRNITMAKLTGKVAVITGGSSGIGLATAQKFVEEGAYVFITGRRQVELERAKKVIGSNVTAVQGDVANLADLDRLYETVKAEKGALDIVVANAGIVEMVTTKDVTPEHYDKTFNVNARGAFFTVQKALSLLRDGSSIVLVGSGVHTKGFPFYVTYAATKAAMRSFVRSWAADFKDRGIRVNTLSPGPIDTPIIDGQFKTKEEAAGMKVHFAQMVPLARLGRADEMASAILFLASDDSSYSTGIDLVADGGITQV